MQSKEGQMTVPNIVILILWFDTKKAQAVTFFKCAAKTVKLCSNEGGQEDKGVN